MLSTPLRRALVSVAALVVLIFELRTALEVAVGVLALFAGIWWLRSRRPGDRRRRVRPKRVRRDVTVVGLTVGGTWVVLALLKLISEVGGTVGADPAQPVPTPDATRWPYAFLVHGMATTAAASALMLAVGMSAPKRPRKRRNRETGLPLGEQPEAATPTLDQRTQ